MDANGVVVESPELDKSGDSPCSQTSSVDSGRSREGLSPGEVKRVDVPAVVLEDGRKRSSKSTTYILYRYKSTNIGTGVSLEILCHESAILCNVQCYQLLLMNQLA